ncbi:unnamed protein product, partial [Prorocentrum cordatum]
MSLLEVLAACPAAAAARGAAAAALGAGTAGKVLVSLTAAAARGAAQGAAAAPSDGGGQGGAGGGLLSLVEDALWAIGRAAGLEGKPTLTEAKSRLREVGPEGAALASRLGRLSRARNSAGHPDVGLARDVAAAFAGKREDKQLATEGNVLQPKQLKVKHGDLNRMGLEAMFEAKFQAMEELLVEQSRAYQLLIEGLGATVCSEGEKIGFDIHAGHVEPAAKEKAKVVSTRGQLADHVKSEELKEAIVDCQVDNAVEAYDDGGDVVGHEALAEARAESFVAASSGFYSARLGRIVRACLLEQDLAASTATETCVEDLFHNVYSYLAACHGIDARVKPSLQGQVDELISCS